MFLFSSAGIEFFHHHSGNEDESHCIACILTSSITILPDSDIQISFEAPENYFTSVPVENSCELLNQFNSTFYPDRAPPQV